ncbi:MAG: YitT family protein [Oscillospiraceae bacterium]|nr:YitT family protein [Oscillospiraceae bacterium]
MPIKNKLTTELTSILMLLCAVAVSFLSVHVFIVPSNFAPSGIEGISMILYEITGINIGWFKLAFNIPLLIVAWICLNKRYVIYVVAFVVLDALGVILMEQIGFFTFVPAGLTAGDAMGYRLISAMVAGVALGICTGLMLRIGCSTGGVDIIACLVSMKKPNFHVERVISVICYGVILCSYFVYRDLTSILLSCIQIFVFEWTAASLLRKDRYAVEVKIITKKPEEIRDEILYKYRHSATILEATGMYTGDTYSMVITVLDSRNMQAFMSSMKAHTDTFIYFTDGVKVQGEYHFGLTESERMDAY